MSWNEIANSDIDLDSPIKTTSLLDRMRGNIVAARYVQFALSLDSTQTTNSAAYTTMGTIYVTVPNPGTESTVTPLITGELLARVSGGTGYIQLEDDSTSTTGSASAITATSNTSSEMTLDVSSWPGTRRAININAKAPAGGTLYLDATNRITSRMVY